MHLLTPSPGPQAACTPHAQWPHSLLPQCPPTRRDVLLLNALQAQAQVLARPRAVHLRLVAVHGHHLDGHPGQEGEGGRGEGSQKERISDDCALCSCKGQTVQRPDNTTGWLAAQAAQRPPRSHTEWPPLSLVGHDHQGVALLHHPRLALAHHYCAHVPAGG